jgi:hypothetical protein
MADRDPTQEELAERAHQIFLRRRGIPGDGREIDDWLQAERELREERERRAPEDHG